MDQTVNIMTDPSSEQIAAELASSIGRRVADGRRRLGISQDQLAILSGASKGTIVQIEQGKANPNITSICRIAVALRVSVEELVSEPPPTSVRFNLADTPKVLWRGPKGGSASLLIGARGPNMLELWKWRLARGEHYVSPGHSPGTREIVHVEKGAIAVEIADVARNIGAGVSAVFEADLPHAYVGRGPGIAHFTMVVEEPASQKRRRDRNIDEPLLVSASWSETVLYPPDDGAMFSPRIDRCDARGTTGSKPVR